MKLSIPSRRLLPRSKKEWLRFALITTVFALAAYLGIGYFRSMMGIPALRPQWEILVFSFVYTAMILFAQVLSSELAHRWLPLRSKLAALGHILIQSVSGVTAFLIAQRLETLVTGQCSIPENLLIIICIVTFVLSLIGNTGFYLMYFHRQMRAAEQAVLESELTALRAQINPHFLFNTLNSIAALIRINPDEAESVTEHLAELFRYSLRSSKTPLVTLEDEIHSVTMYLRIEQARFRERLEVEMKVPQHLHDAAVPSLLLQPLVENAIKHGANVVEGTFHISIEAQEKDGVISLAVRDSGYGFDLSRGEELFGKGTGLMNVRDRLMLLFPDSGALRIEKNGVVLIFPHEVRNNSHLMGNSSSVLQSSRRGA